MKRSALKPGPADLDNAVGPDACPVRVLDADRVEATRARLLPGAEAVRVADLFRLLGDPRRVQMLCALLEAGELCVCDLAAVVDMTESSVSHSLRLLRTAGIVRHRRSGRQVFYSLDDAHVRLLLDVSVAHICHADASCEPPWVGWSSRPWKRGWSHAEGDQAGEADDASVLP